LLVVQIAVCAVLVTSSLVAVRGLIRSLHSNFGFSPEGAMIARFGLQMAGYDEARAEQFQREALESVQRIPGVYAAGYINHPPLSVSSSDSLVYANGTTDFRPLNSIADAMFYKVSPGYFGVAQTALLAGRGFTWHDDPNAPKVAVVNETFARKVFGSVSGAVGGHFMNGDRVRIEVVGVVQDGKYRTLTEEQQPAMFWPILQDRTDETTLVVRSNRSAPQVAGALQKTLTSLDAGLPVLIQTWPDAMSTARGQSGDGRSGSHGDAGRDAGCDGRLRHGLLYREQAHAGVGHTRCPWSATQGGSAGRAGAIGKTALRRLDRRVVAGDGCQQDSGVGGL
jgi:hypothetical protein